MKLVWQSVAMLMLVCILTSCKPLPADKQFVRQIIPIEIQSGKPVTIEIHHLSGNGWNDVGIRCSPEVWNVLTNAMNSIAVRLKSSNKMKTEVQNVCPGSGDPYFLSYVTNVHYLFLIGGEYHAAATVEITFSNAPAGVTPAEIIVGKTPADTGL